MQTFAHSIAKVLEVWAPQHQHHLGTSYKYKFSVLTPDLLKKKVHV